MPAVERAIWHVIDLRYTVLAIQSVAMEVLNEHREGEVAQVVNVDGTFTQGWRGRMGGSVRDCKGELHRLDGDGYLDRVRVDDGHRGRVNHRQA